MTNQTWLLLLAWISVVMAVKEGRELGGGYGAGGVDYQVSCDIESLGLTLSQGDPCSHC
jgi:hypothetical protein